MINRIVITGPESSGKTTLSEFLSEEYSLPLVKEYAREYLENLKTEYSFEDVLIMAKEQLNQEQKVAKRIAICDTDLTVFYVWIKEKYNRELDWINHHLFETKNKIYLLCDVIEGWEEDPLREHSNFEDRKRLFNEYVRLLKDNGLIYHIISGDLRTRIKKCKEILDSIL